MTYVSTPAGLTNTRTGEILDEPIDLSPLRYKPRGRVRRAPRRYKRKDDQTSNSIAFIALVLALATNIT